MTIRLATPADVPGVAETVRQAYSPYIARMGKPPGPMLDDYEALVAGSLVHVVDDEEGVAGLVVVFIEGATALLDNVAVADRARRKGLGRRLVAFAEEKARAAGCGSIRLYTHVTMTENIALYRRLGFAETHRAVEKGYDRVYMAKALLV